MTTISAGPLSEIRPTLPGHYYWSDEVYQLEKERIFYSSWLCAGRVTEVPHPGDFFIRQVCDENIIVTRDKSNNINAFYNVCRHRGTRLCREERGRFKSAISCPYHGWTYDLNGRLLSTPNMIDVPGFIKEDYSLQPVAVHLWEGFIFINLSSEPEPFEPNFGAVVEKLPRYNLSNLKAGHRIVYDIHANWKIVVENNIECYHCPLVHPELCQIQPGFRGGAIGQETVDGASLIEGGTTYSTTAKGTRPSISTLTGEDIGKFRSTTLYPNFFMGLLPDHVFSFTKWPLGPKRTRLIVEWLFEPTTIDAPGFDPSDTVEFLDMVLRQDWAICQEVQIGVQSRAFGQGSYVPNEWLPYKFNQWVLKRLEGGSR